ncbi:MAG: hypothetical protein COU33_02165, partial [Candidatus Magasanikbacteria bacterium CG10_big_fil_rev_8_21_14_0_10_43_6]
MTKKYTILAMALFVAFSFLALNYIQQDLSGTTAVAGVGSVPISTYDNLQGFWRFDNDFIDASPSFNPNKTTPTNASCVSASCPLFDAPGKQGSGSVKLDGEDDWVNLNNNFGKIETLSVSLWFKTNDTTQDQALFATSDSKDPSTGSPTSYVPNIVVKNNGTLRAEWWTGSAAEAITTTNTYNDNAWHHVVFIGNDNGTPTEILYVDGVLVGSRGPDNINHFYWTNTQVGTGYDGSGRTGRVGATNNWLHANATIDEVAVWNKALTAQEVQDLYAMGTENIPQSDFVFYDELIFKTRPAIIHEKLVPISVIYGHEYWPGGADRSLPPDPQVVRDLGTKYKNIGYFTSHDIEAFYQNPNQMQWYEDISREFQSTYG